MGFPRQFEFKREPSVVPAHAFYGFGMKDKTTAQQIRGNVPRNASTLTPPQVDVTRQKPASLILALICGVCVFLTIVCCCLVALVIFLDKKVKVGFEQHWDPNRPQEYMKMAGRDSSSDLRFRLPKEVVPVHYDLFLHPDLEKGTFQGNVTIKITVNDQRNYIALHQKDLEIISASLKSADREDDFEWPIKEYYTVENLEELLVKFEDELYPGMYNLSFEFTGALQPDKIVGFYSSTYKDADNKTRHIATSKFEPTYARRAFPCFDEPAFKAEYSVRLVHPTGDCYGALSSMNVESTLVDKPGPGLTTVTFAKSVPMSTYLIAFIVSDFVGVTAPATNLAGETFPITVYTTRAQKQKAVFALDIGVKIIEYYMTLFTVNYPLPKLDMAAIPDFVSGAMENWGLVTYREARILYDKKISSTSDKESVVLVISHEFAHMWFGNLVTMGWWNDLWLNEGFATFMQYKSADAILPDWSLMDKFLTSTLHSVLIADAKLSSHPIVQTVGNPDEITAIFDVITYSKGAAVLRMLENFVSPEIFYAGVTAYLNKFAFKNAVTADLFDILQKAITNNINVTAIMDTWTRQMGYPVVNVAKNGLTYTLTQKRFLADPEANFDPAECDYRYKWTIPITYITDKNQFPTLIWFDKDASKLEVKLDEPVEWIKFNHKQVGFYRVNYATAEWQNLSQILRSHHKRFSVSDRTHLLEEAFSLAQASEIEYSVALNLAKYIRFEKSAVPWSVATSKFAFLDKFLSSTDVTSKYREYVRNLVSDTYDDVTWKVDDFEDHDMLSLRRSVLKLACVVGHQKCLDEAGAIFNAWINDTNDVRPPPDIRGLVYYYGMNHVGEEAEWNIMFKRFTEESNAAEKLKLMTGLAGVRSSWILKKFITMAVDEKYVRNQDTFGCLTAISTNPVGTPLVWDWVRENWEFLVNRYTLNDRYLGRLIPDITNSFSTKVKLREMQAFFAKYPDAGAGKSARASALETVASNIEWVQTNSKKIESWLDSVSK